MAVDNSDNSKGRSRLSSVSPGNRVRRSRCAGLVTPGLGCRILSRHANDGAVLSLAVGHKIEVVVAAGVALTAVAAQVVDGPSLIGLVRVGAWSTGWGRNRNGGLGGRRRA